MTRTHTLFTQTHHLLKASNICFLRYLWIQEFRLFPFNVIIDMLGFDLPCYSLKSILVVFPTCLIDFLFPLPTFSSFSFVFLDFIYLFLEKGREGEREGEKQRCVRETSIGCLWHTPDWGPGLQPRPVLWLGIELATFHFAGRSPTNWTTPVRAFFWMN